MSCIQRRQGSCSRRKLWHGYCSCLVRLCHRHPQILGWQPGAVGPFWSTACRRRSGLPIDREDADTTRSRRRVVLRVEFFNKLLPETFARVAAAQSSDSRTPAEHHVLSDKVSDADHDQPREGDDPLTRHYDPTQALLEKASIAVAEMTIGIWFRKCPW